MRIILLLIFGISILQCDFVKSTNVVKDNLSKLEWQDDTVGLSITWQEAVTKCETLVLNGYSDWRVPNINELRTIIDRSTSAPAVNSIFANTKSGTYWSSTTYNDSFLTEAWIVSFFNGTTSTYRKNGTSYVRCVRGGQ